MYVRVLACSGSTMGDTRLFCLVIAVSLMATTTAKPSVNETEAVEVKELLGAMKRYLQAESDEREKSGRTNAHYDVRTVYSPCKISF